MEQSRVLLFINPENHEIIEQAFLRNNFITFSANNSGQIITTLKENNPHLVVADLDLIINPTGKKIQKFLNDKCTKTGLILLDKNKTTQECIRALEQGADDYFPLTSAIEELIAKSKAIIRCIHRIDEMPKILQVRDIVINLDTHEVSQDDKLIDLTYTQFKILYLLASKRDCVFTRNEILDKVWGENAYITYRTVDVHIKRIREKLGERKEPYNLIQTIHGLGYKFA